MVRPHVAKVGHAANRAAQQFVAQERLVEHVLAIGVLLILRVLVVHATSRRFHICKIKLRLRTGENTSFQTECQGPEPGFDFEI